VVALVSVVALQWALLWALVLETVLAREYTHSAAARSHRSWDRNSASAARPRLRYCIRVVGRALVAPVLAVMLALWAQVLPLASVMVALLWALVLETVLAREYTHSAAARPHRNWDRNSASAARPRLRYCILVVGRALAHPTSGCRPNHAQN